MRKPESSIRTRAASFALVALLTACLAHAPVRADGQALRKFNEFVQSSDTPAMRLLREGRDLIDSEQWAQAAEKFSRYVNAHGQERDVDLALFWLAYSLNKQGDARAAATYLSALLKNHQGSAWADESRALLNEIAAKLGQTKVIQNTLESANEEEEIKIIALQSLYEANPERAFTYIKEILKINSDAGLRLKQSAVSLLSARRDPQSATILLNVARSHPDADLRARAVHSLANESDATRFDELARLYDAERDPKVKRQILHAFSQMADMARAHAKLLEIARNQNENEDLRRHAIHWIGERKTPAAFDALAQLYDSERDLEIKRQIVHGFFDTEDPRAFAKLLEIARNASEHMDIRRYAVHWIGERDTPAAFDALTQIYSSEQSPEVKRQLLHAFAESKDPRAFAKLAEIARNPTESKDLRRHAVHSMSGNRTGAALEELLKLYERDADSSIRRVILQVLMEMDDPRARAKVLEAARSGPDVGVRRAAIHRLSESKDPQTFETLIGMYDAETDLEVKRQLLHAFANSKRKRGLQKLMDVARRDPNVALRKEAVHWLGESNDPDALKFLEELLKP